MRRGTNALLALLSTAALLASAALYAHDRQSRIAPESFAKKYTMPLRRPEVMESLALAASAGEADDLVADTAIRDAVSPVSLAGAKDEVRRAWLDLVTRADDELKGASGIALNAIEQNPGWPYHEALLGETVYARRNRNLSGKLVTSYEEWRAPLLAGAEAANVDDDLWQALATAYIQTWPDLGRVHEKSAGIVFHRAFEDPDFVNETFSVAMQTIGKERAVRAIPDRAKPLWAAFQQLAKSGDVLTAWSVHQRWDAAEWRERGEDLAAIEQMSKRGDLDETRRLCQQWVSRHSVWNYDSPAAHEQAARLLDLWPAGTEGQWRSDARADIIRYFLAGRTADVDGAALERTLGSIANVPEAVAARIDVLAGDIAAAESIARADDGFGSFEWTPYILELARYWNGKDKAKAREAFAQLAPAARQECDAVAVQRLIEGRNSVASGLRELSPRTAVGSPIPLCMDRTSPVVAVFSGTPPAIVDYGWDGARSGSTLLASAAQSLSVPSPETEGMRNLVTKPVACIAPPVEVAVQNP